MGLRSFRATDHQERRRGTMRVKGKSEESGSQWNLNVQLEGWKRMMSHKKSRKCELWQWVLVGFIFFKIQGGSFLDHIRQPDIIMGSGVTTFNIQYSMFNEFGSVECWALSGCAQFPIRVAVFRVAMQVRLCWSFERIKQLESKRPYINQQSGSPRKAPLPSQIFTDKQ